MLPGTLLHISSISTLTRQCLCALLDTEDQLGRDWCLLAVRMGLIDKVPKLEGARRGQSQMGKLLDEWERQPASSIGELQTQPVTGMSLPSVRPLLIKLLVLLAPFHFRRPRATFRRYWTPGCRFGAHQRVPSLPHKTVSDQNSFFRSGEPRSGYYLTTFIEEDIYRNTRFQTDKASSSVISYT